MADLEAWRQQFAREDSDDEDGGLPPSRGNPFDNNDLGLALEELPLPSHIPNVANVSFAESRMKQMPPRAGVGPAVNLPPRRPTGGGGANADTTGSASDSRELLLHKLEVAHLKLEERDLELAAARNNGGGGGGGSGSGTSDDNVREAKMKELAKRAKAATMALGRERAKGAELTAELAQLKRERDGYTKAGTPAEGSAAARLAAASASVSDERNGLDPEARERELKESKKQLGEAHARLHEAKVSQQAAKAELEKYKRALVKEVGDEVPLQKLLDEASGAKGRAQQIHQLKDQVKSLNRKLERLNGGGDDGNGGDGTMGVPPTPSVLDGSDERQRGALNQMEQDRRREHERILLREQELDAELVETRKKLTAMDARIKNLEADVKGKKERLKLMIEKSDSDDKLIEALRAELTKATTSASPAAGGAGRGRGGGGGRAAASGGGVDAEKLASRISQQQSQIDRQEQIIHALKDQLQQQQQQENAGGKNGGSGAAVPRALGRGAPSPRQPPHADLVQMQSENAKLRELVQLLQEKLADAEMRGDGEY